MNDEQTTATEAAIETVKAKTEALCMTCVGTKHPVMLTGYCLTGVKCDGCGIVTDCATTTEETPELVEENPNVNCLEGMACPQCGRYEPFLITVTTCITMHDNGSDAHGDTEWDGDSDCSCMACNYSGKVRDFREGDPEPAAAAKLTPYRLATVVRRLKELAARAGMNDFTSNAEDNALRDVIAFLGRVSPERD